MLVERFGSGGGNLWMFGVEEFMIFWAARWSCGVVVLPREGLTSAITSGCTSPLINVHWWYLSTGRTAHRCLEGIAVPQPLLTHSIEFYPFNTFHLCIRNLQGTDQHDLCCASLFLLS